MRPLQPSRPADRARLVLLAVAVFFLAAIVAPSGSPQAWAGVEERTARYVFLFIGDGMGLAQRQAAELQMAVREGRTGPDAAGLAMDGLPVHGLTTTHSADSSVTDSAAAATAMACGIKTANGMLGLDPGGTRVSTIAEMARDKGMKVGIVTTVSLDHATAAAFYAHNPSRRNYHAIGLELPRSGFDYLAGGGFLDPAGERARGEGGTSAGVLDEVRRAGYRIVETAAEFRGLAAGAGRIVFMHPSRREGESMPFAMDAAQGDITLAEMTAKGIELLDSPTGFFLMVEGGKIDWACHANDAAAAIGDTVALDRAVAEALKFLASHPEDTTVVVTGDHETGGLAIGAIGTSGDPGPVRETAFSWTTRSHTGIPVITSAAGLGRDAFGGWYDNTGLFSRLRAVMGLGSGANSLPSRVVSK